MQFDPWKQSWTKSSLALGFSWVYQIILDILQKTRDEACGIAQPLSPAEEFADDDNVAVIPGDNIFLNSVKDAIQSFTSGVQVASGKGAPDLRRQSSISGPRYPGIDYLFSAIWNIYIYYQLL